MQRSVPEQTKPAGIGSDVTTDLARPLGTEIEREDVAMGGELVVDRLEDGPGIDREGTGHGVERSNLVEVGEVEDEFVVDRGRAACDETIEGSVSS